MKASRTVAVKLKHMFSLHSNILKTISQLLVAKVSYQEKQEEFLST